MTTHKMTLKTLLYRYSDACINLAHVQQEWDDYNVPYEDLLVAKQEEENTMNAIVRFVDELSK